MATPAPAPSVVADHVVGPPEALVDDRGKRRLVQRCLRCDRVTGSQNDPVFPRPLGERLPAGKACPGRLTG